MRRARLVSLLALLAVWAAAPAVTNSFSDSARDVRGYSGKLLAMLVDDKALMDIKRDGVAVRQPAGKVPENPLHYLLMVPFSAKVKGRVGPYMLGSWPNEDPSTSTGRAANVAREQPAYALPRGFIEVTRNGMDTEVSEHFKLGDFLTHDQQDVWPKYLVLDLQMVDKLELVREELNRTHKVDVLHVMSGFRTPAYNAKDVGPRARSAISRHMYGDAADVFPDDDHNGWTDDLNGDGRADLADAKIIAAAAEAVEKKYPSLIGGIGIYPATSAHGPMVHIDTRGKRARW